MANEIERGHCGTMWKQEYKYLQYTYDPIDQYQLAKYVDEGYTNIKSFVCETYNDVNILPPWVVKTSGIFGLYSQQYEFLKVRPLDIAPPYNPSVRRYRDKYKVDRADVWHAVLMLEDWQPGQYIEVNGEPFVRWTQGDWFKWKNTTDSSFSYTNVGQTNWYMMHVTGKNTYTGQLNNLFAFNFPGRFDDPRACHPFIQNSLIPEVNFSQDPNFIWAVYMDNGYIKQLDDINFTEAQVEVVNQRGIHFYLFEVMCSYYEDQIPYDAGGTIHTQGFYSEFEHPHNKKKLRAEELDAILNFKNRNNINAQMIHVHTGEYNIQKHYPYYTDHLTLTYDDLYVKTQRPIVNLDGEVDLDKIKFTKHAVSLNWRYCKHRQLVANFLAGENVHLSWYFKNEFDMLKKELWFDLDSWKEKYPKLYNQLEVNNQNILQRSPFCVDKHTLDAKEIKHPHHVDFWPGVSQYKPGQTPSLYNSRAPELKPIYDDCFVDIVTETRFAQPTGNFSEKLLQPVQYMKPFILLAPPYTLECFKSFGYASFSDFWDESYDTEEDHGERLAKIFTVIRKILDTPMKQLEDMYKEMYPLLVHNRKRFNELTNYPNYTLTEDFE